MQQTEQCWHIWDDEWTRHCCDRDAGHTDSHHCICGETLAR